MKATRKAVCILIAVLLCSIGFVSAFAAETYTLYVDADKKAANVGDIVSVQIELKPNAHVSSMTFCIMYDTDSFEYQGNAENGALLKACEASSNVNASTKGKIVFSFMTEASLYSGGELMTASFKVLKPNGKINIVLDTVSADDMDGTDVTANGKVESLTVLCAHGAEKTWNVIKQPTHIEDGEKEWACTSCGEPFTTDSIPATGHSFGAWTVTKASTCTAKGIETRTCSCGAKETREIAIKAHIAGEWEVKTAPTCEGKGAEVQKCTACGTVISTRETAAKGHTFGEWSIVKDATCTEKGEKKSACTVCGKAVTEEIPAKGHIPSEWEIVTEADCTADGEEKSVCTVCGEEYTEIIPALGHKFGEWAITKEATDTAEGSKERTCSVCGEKEAVVIPALSAKPSEDIKNPEIPNTSAFEETYFAALTAVMSMLACGYAVVKRRKLCK